MQSDISMTFAPAAGGGRIQSTVNAACTEDELLSSDGKNIKATNPKVCRFFVPHIGVEPMIYCVRGSCPGPLDECGSY